MAFELVLELVLEIQAFFLDMVFGHIIHIHIINIIILKIIKMINLLHQ